MSRHVRSLYQTPRYREEWEELSVFKDWLTKGPEVIMNQRSAPTTKAYCMLCEDVIEPLYDALMDHSELGKHKAIVRARSNAVENGARDKSLALTVDDYFRLRSEFSLISSQVIDSLTGQPAEGLDIRLYKQSNDPLEEWELLSQGDTDVDGYLDSLIFHTTQLPAGVYKMEYMLQEYYFNGRRLKTTYPMVQPTFEVLDNMVHYHFKLLIAPHFHQVYIETEKVKPNGVMADENLHSVRVLMNN